MNGGFLIRVLGPVDVSTVDGTHTIGSRNERALLAALVLSAGRSVPTSLLRDVVWADHTPSSPDASLHTYVSRLRRLLGSERIERSDHSYRLVVARDEVDAARFEDLVDEATRCDDDAARRLHTCRTGLALWRGNPFGDLGDDEAFRLEAMRLDELRLVMMELALGAELDLGRHEIAAAELETAVWEHPYRERLWLLLGEALRRDGRRVEALRTCERLRRVLADAGLAPGPELIDLERRIAGTAPPV